MNTYLNTASAWVWGAALPSLGLSLFLGAIVGDLLFFLKDWLIKKAIKLASASGLAKGINISEYSAEQLAKHIKFSTATKVNVLLMNLAAAAEILLVIVAIVAFVKVICAPVKIVDGLPDITQIQKICSSVNDLPGDLPSNNSSSTPAQIPNLR